MQSDKTAQLTENTSGLEEAKQEAVEARARLEAELRRLRGEHSSLQVTLPTLCNTFFPGVKKCSDVALPAYAISGQD